MNTLEPKHFEKIKSAKESGESYEDIIKNSLAGISTATGKKLSVAAVSGFMRKNGYRLRKKHRRPSKSAPVKTDLSLKKRASNSAFESDVLEIMATTHNESLKKKMLSILIQR
jgi:hypothetical protein